MRYIQASDEVEIIVDLKQTDCWFGLVLGQSDMAVGGDMITFESSNSVGFYQSIGF